MHDIDASFEDAFGQAVELGNRMSDGDQKTDVWDVADGLLAGALQFWLYSRQPCGDPTCEDCTTISTADDRMKQLRTLIEQFTSQSEYFHSPQDTNVGRA